VNVLVVEDAAPIRARMVMLLAEVPGVAAVIEAEDVAQATLHLRACGPEILVLDLHLRHGESGLPFLRLARRERPRIVIIVVTNLPTDQHRRECLSSGADHFFDKSSQFDAVLDLVAMAAGPTDGVPRSDA
jgi:DNA-binding NarL/FixJ family response regulator